MVLLTSFLVSLVAVLWVWLAGRRDPKGVPWLTVLCLFVLVFSPLLSMLPKLRLAVLGTESVAGSAVYTGAGGMGWLMGWWLVGVGVMVVRMVVQRVRLQRWLAMSEEMDDVQGWRNCVDGCSRVLGWKGEVEVRVMYGLSSPVVAGLFRKVVLVPATAGGWSGEMRRMVLLHELSHIQRRDLWMRLVAEVACVLHWCNPLVWWLKGRLLTQCEYACDAWVIDAGVDRRGYISALCDVVEASLMKGGGRLGVCGVAAMADHAPLVARVECLLGSGVAIRPWKAVFAAVLTVVVAFGLSLVRPEIEVGVSDEGGEAYLQSEVDLRHAADPFPGD